MIESIFVFLAPLLILGIVATIFLETSRFAKGRQKIPSYVALTCFAVSNSIFLLMNGASSEMKPFGPFDTWFGLWAFTFLPVSIAFSMVLFSLSSRILER